VPYAFLDHPGPIPYAHRGGALEGLENTMPAFEAAIALGYRYLETDARVTSDGVLVAFHDDDLSRTCDRAGLISELPWSEVQTARVDGKEPIPLMEDVLGTFPQARINLDAKSDRAVPPLIEAIRRTASVERVCVGAFSGKRLKEIRSTLGPTLCTSMGPLEVTRWMAASLLGGRGTPSVPVAQVPCKQFGIPVVTGRSVRAADRRGIQVHVWTIDDQAEMESLLDLGVHGIMTDRPQVLKEVLQRRGQWFE
jgi:glycerophosphoryl diester phosphodiesterase